MNIDSDDEQRSPIAPSGDTVVITLSGEVDWTTVDEVRGRLADALGSGASVVIDLAEVTFFDSTALGMLAVVHRKISDRPLILRRPPPLVQRLLRITGIDGMVSIEP